MKNLKFLFILFIPMFCNFQCGKEPEEKQPYNPPHCTDCDNNLISDTESDSVYFFVPTAFTPNGDGKNDYLRPVYKGIKEHSFGMTIYDENERLVKVFTDPSDTWDGKDGTGKVMPVEHYPATITYQTNTGRKVEICACITLLQYSNGCIPTGGAKYYFEDQLDTQKGFIYDTGETLCK